MGNYYTRAALCVLAAAVTACGGGGSSSSGSSSSSSNSMGAASVALTDAPSAQFSHVWITVKDLWFHTSATADPDDAGWLKFPLPQPETFDLLALANGNLATAFSGITLPTGNYQQIRLYLDDPSDALQPSAQADGLQYNDQVNYTDSQGAAQVAPLELVNPEKGIGVVGHFGVSSGATLSLALEFDAADDVLQFDYGSQSAFVLKPRLQYFDLSSVGAIVGKVDPTALASATNPNGASDLVIKAESLSSDGTYHTISRLTGVRADGSFTLFPLSVPQGSASTSYDVVVRGRKMQTIIVKGVKVNAGTGPASGQNPTQLQADPLALTAGTDFTANEAANQPLTPTSDTVLFYQTLPLTGEVPYAVRIRESNPFSGTFFQDIPLSAGPVEYGSYNNGTDISLTTVNPVEGVGTFQVFGNADDYVRTAASANVSAAQAPATGAEAFTVPALAVAAPGVADSIGGSLTQTKAGTYDSGYLIVSHKGDIVTTIPLASVLAQNGGSGGAYLISDLPGGSTSQNFAEGLYYLYLRVWNSGNPRQSLHRESMAAVVDLRSGSASNVNFVVH
ncbi:MAG: DUF4382 domain-containing protein [Nevskia sp.]|nr:DUF4382 domain-containing protein [Nevskia sp.]